MARKQENFKLPKGMLAEVDRFIAENPGMGFEDRDEVLKAALREYILSGGKTIAPTSEKSGKPAKTEEAKVSEDKITQMMLEMIVYDSFWADGLNKEYAKERNNLISYPLYMKPPNGESRIVSKNIDQWDILEKVLKKDLNKAEIERLRDFMKYYAQNYEKVKVVADKIREKLPQKEAGLD